MQSKRFDTCIFKSRKHDVMRQHDIDNVLAVDSYCRNVIVPHCS
jgi:hypothetical protein